MSTTLSTILAEKIREAISADDLDSTADLSRIAVNIQSAGLMLTPLSEASDKGDAGRSAGPFFLSHTTIAPANPLPADIDWDRVERILGVRIAHPGRPLLPGAHDDSSSSAGRPQSVLTPEDIEAIATAVVQRIEDSRPKVTLSEDSRTEAEIVAALLKSLDMQRLVRR